MGEEGRKGLEVIQEQLEESLQPQLWKQQTHNTNRLGEGIDVAREYGIDNSQPNSHKASSNLSVLLKTKHQTTR